MWKARHTIKKYQFSLVFFLNNLVHEFIFLILTFAFNELNKSGNYGVWNFSVPSLSLNVHLVVRELKEWSHDTSTAEKHIACHF